MGSPYDDRGRHGQHSGDGAAATRQVVFTTSLPDAYGDLAADPLEMVLDVPAPRTPDDEPTAWPLLDSPVDAPTAAIRHVVMPPPLDDDAFYEPIYQSATRTHGARWGFVLGGAVVAVCTAYIAVAGVGALNREPGSSANAALTGPPPAVTFSASAVPPAPAADPTGAAPVARDTQGGGVVAPAAVPEPVVDPVVDPVVSATDPTEDARVERAREGRRGATQTPRVATPPSSAQTPTPRPTGATQPPTGPPPSPVTSAPTTTTVVPTT